MDIMEIIAEEKIREAMENGEFDHLPGKGKPLKLEDLSGIPSDLRLGYKILKNAGVLPEEMQLKKELLTLQDLLASCRDEDQKASLKKELNEKMLRFNMLMERRSGGSPGVLELYRGKIEERFNKR